MRRWDGRARAAVLLLLTVAAALAVVLGAPQARAGGLAGKLPRVTSSTSPVLSTPPTTLPRSPTPTTATTRPRTATTVKRPVPTVKSPVAPVTLAPARPNTIPAPTTTTIPPTTTTILGIRSQLPVPPVTLPLHTSGSNGHVNPVFAWLSGIGFAVALLIVAGRLLVTREGGKDRAPLS